MKRAAGSLSGIAALLLCAAAPAAMTVTGGGSYPYADWIAGSQVPTPDALIEVREAPCPHRPEALGCANREVIYLDVRRGHDSATLRRAFLHEVGHVFEFIHLDAGERGRYQAMRGLSGSWSAPPDWTDYEPANSQERFAEDYSACATDSAAPPPTTICAFIRKAHAGSTLRVCKPKRQPGVTASVRSSHCRIVRR